MVQRRHSNSGHNYVLSFTTQSSSPDIASLSAWPPNRGGGARVKPASERDYQAGLERKSAGSIARGPGGHGKSVADAEFIPGRQRFLSEAKAGRQVGVG